MVENSKKISGKKYSNDTSFERAFGDMLKSDVKHGFSFHFLRDKKSLQSLHTNYHSMVTILINMVTILINMVTILINMVTMLTENFSNVYGNRSFS